MTAPLLQTKFYIPPTRPESVPRARLIDQLNAGRRHKLTLISAPAGFGKTTLLGEWARASSSTQRHVVWLTLDEDDNDPLRFLAYLVTAFHQADEHIGSGLLIALQTPRPAPQKELLTLLINQLGAAEVEFVLVLDDYHVIDNPIIHEGIAYLLDHRPTNLRLVIATRADPALPLARLRGRGQLTELRQADLRFTQQEAIEFLTRAMGVNLSADAAATLAAHTEGWIAGLQMAAVSMQHRQDTASFVQAFTGSNRHILDYLVDEVLHQQSDRIQTFLLKTSILDRMCAPLCAAVLAQDGSDDCQGVLDYLERANLFVIPLDDRRAWFRYHRLFADLLLKQLQQLHPNQVQDLHRRAGAWYEGEGLIEEAIDHAIAANDFQHAVELIEGAAEETMMRSQVATFLGWMDALPAQVTCVSSRLCALHAGAMMMASRPLAEVEARLQDAEDADTENTAVGEIAAFRAFIAVLQGQTDQGIELANRALAYLPERDALLRSLVLDNLGMAYTFRSNIPAAVDALEEASRVSLESGNVMIAAGALGNLAGLHLMKGELHRAAEIYRRTLALSVDEDGNPLPVAGKVMLGLGELERQWNNLDAAAHYLAEGTDLVNQFAAIGAIIGYTSLAMVKQAQGEEDAANELIQKAWHAATQFDTSQMDDSLVAACEARIRIAQGDLQAASRWATERDLDAETVAAALAKKGFYDLQELEYLTLARLCIAQGQAEQALAILTPLLERAERLGRIRRVIEILVLQARALDISGEREAAGLTLARALTLGESEGYARVFLDEGQPMATMLRRVAARGVTPDYTSRLLASFKGPQPTGTRPPGPKSPLAEPLTDREQEILRLLATHLTSTEIADELIISPNTVRYHIKNIYGKLNVHNRSAAVERAAEIGLI
jgi:LuxR family maltose regulon positive regulatory protein